MARILVVDDENNIRMTIRIALQHIGYEVETAADGPEALTKFGDGTGFDLVILDQRMPGMEGLEILREMQQRNATPRIIMATAFGTIDLAVEAMKMGATDFLRKPFTAEVLRGAVRAALQEAPPVAPVPGVTFVSTTINGFRIEFQAGSGERVNGDFHQRFTVHSPMGETAACQVVLPAYLLELVKAHADREQMPGSDRFWQALCEEALANHLWQHAGVPAGGVLRVEELTTGLRRYVDTVLAA